MFLGYNTNGFAHHRLDDAIEIMAELGYRGVALTPDVHHFGFLEDVGAHDLSDSFFLTLNASNITALVVETGARYFLDPRRKHQPTLISASGSERGRRLAFLEACVGVASQAQPRCVSFWSGSAADDAAPAVLMLRLVEGCKRLADYAAGRNVRLAFEPEPGMFIDTMDKFAELHARVNHPAFGLTIDVGHLVCNRELPVSKFLAEWKQGLHQYRYEQAEKTDMSKVPTPRFDLLKMRHYAFGSVQFTRGCPFQCEFCDIIVTFGRRPPGGLTRYDCHRRRRPARYRRECAIRGP